jgi:hypothetical protein
MSEQRLVLVVGVGRSGTSLLSGILGQLGLHIPKPEVQADETNPRGFGEPRWAVDFHTRLLRSRRVTVNDSRPAAFATMAKLADDPGIRGELHAWLGGQLAENGAIVVKDPRTAWFLPLWTACAQDLGVTPDFVTMLRHPAETLTSARKSYGTWQPVSSRAGAWVNVSLETERATRGARRAFIRYDDLLADWRREVTRLGELVRMPALAAPDPGKAQGVDEFVDPTLHRNRVGWDDLDGPVPASVRDLAETAWERLLVLTRDGGDGPDALAALDDSREAYAALYGQAEEFVHSSISAVRRHRPKAAAAAPPPTLYVRLARRVPARWRRRVRGVLGRSS